MNVKALIRLIFISLVSTVPSLVSSSDKTRARFSSPVEIPIYLSGTFGEIRGGHFHAGIDIKTYGKEGLNVLAVEEGHVSRIKISSVGYGKALYIDHPNGFTTVYAHLKNFNDRIENYIKEIQYQKESFEVDEYLDAGQLKVIKGEIVALSGNSGGSSGPHVHFEVRESHTQIPVNPLAFGIVITDNLAPVVSDLMIYPMDAKGKHAPPIREKVVKKEDSFALGYDTILINSRMIGLGLHTFDQMEGTANKNGIHEMKLQIDGETIYQFIMDKISFGETRYVQAHVDYKTRQEQNIKVHRFYQLPGNKLSIYDSIRNAGIFRLDEHKTHHVVMCIKDFNNNTSFLNFCMKLDVGSNVVYADLEYDTVFNYQVNNTFQTDEVKVYLPQYTLYDTLYFNYEKVNNDKPGNRYSALHRIHYEFEPAHKNFTVSIKPAGLPAQYKNKAVLVLKSETGKIDAKKSYWSDNYLSAKTRDFGTYYIAIDTTKPVIKPVNIHDNKVLTYQANIKVKISDDLSGISSYRATINDNWILMEYDAKNNLLTYNFDDRVKQGTHNFVLTVKDNANNHAYYKTYFRR